MASRACWGMNSARSGWRRKSRSSPSWCSSPSSTTSVMKGISALRTTAMLDNMLSPFSVPDRATVGARLASRHIGAVAAAADDLRLAEVAVHDPLAAGRLARCRGGDVPRTRDVELVSARRERAPHLVGHRALDVDVTIHQPVPAG